MISSAKVNKPALKAGQPKRLLSKRQRISPDEFFMRYAYPCSQNLLMLNLVSKKDYERFEEMMQEGKLLPRPFAEKIFHAAFRRIREVAKDMGIKDAWDIKVLMRYWHEMHNKYIDAGDGNYGKQPKTFCDLCKVYAARVVDKRDRVFVVTYTDGGKPQTRTVVSDQLLEADIGDTIRIHSGYAVEFTDSE